MRMIEKTTSLQLPAESAARYFSAVLSTGGSSPQSPIHRHMLSQTFYAIAPEGLDGARLLDFEHGGILHAPEAISHGSASIQGVPNTVSSTAPIVAQELIRYSRPVLWIHEPLLTKEQVELENLPYEILGGNIYLVSEGDLDEQRIEKLIRYSLQSWHFLMFVTDGHQRFQSADELILSAKFVLVGAYDGESFLYTRRS